MREFMLLKLIGENIKIESKLNYELFFLNINHKIQYMIDPNCYVLKLRNNIRHVECGNT